MEKADYSNSITVQKKGEIMRYTDTKGQVQLYVEERPTISKSVLSIETNLLKKYDDRDGFHQLQFGKIVNMLASEKSYAISDTITMAKVTAIKDKPKRKKSQKKLKLY